MQKLINQLKAETEADKTSRILQLLENKVTPTLENISKSTDEILQQSEEKEAGEPSYAEKVKSNKDSYINIRTSNSTQGDTKFQQLSDQHDEKKRSLNIIIHGIKETANAEILISSFCREVGGHGEDITKIIRIGRKEQGKCRPIKLIFKDELSKKKIMDNLTKLKGKQEYVGISITHDYSFLERRLIKSWVEQAREKSAKSDRYTFKVWGNVKDGLYLKRF